MSSAGTRVGQEGRKGCHTVATASTLDTSFHNSQNDAEQGVLQGTEAR